MSGTRLTAPSVDQSSDSDHGTDGGGGPARHALVAAPVVFVLLLLLLATAFHGAFNLRDWGPPAVLVIGTLLALQLAGGGLPIRDRWAKLMLVGLWGLAGWMLLSMLWSPSPAAAWEGAGRTALYAALVTMPLVLVPRGRLLELLGLGVVAGISVIALVTLARMLVGADGVFLAGRLDDPVGYRNATALLFALAFWPLIALAARGPKRAFRAGALALAALCLGLAFLTQSRGIVLGLGAGGVVALALGPERVRRAWLAIVAAGAVAVFSPLLLSAYDAFDGGQGIVTDDDIAEAALGTLLMTVAVFVVGMAIALIDNGLRTGTAAMGRARSAARLALVAIVVVGAAGALAMVGNPISEARDKWDEFRANETIAEGSTRLGNVSGQRYDLWRVATEAFTAHPVAGVGEGGYAFEYYRERTNDRNLDDAHGLPFQTGAELGLVGLGLLLLFVVGAAGALITRFRGLPPARARLAAGMAASGAVLLGQSLVDWMWRIPGVTGLGLLCLGIAVGLTLDPAPRTGGRRLPLPTRAATTAGLAVALIAVVVLYVSDFHVRQARARSDDAPKSEIAAARTAADLNPLSVVPWYLMASAHETEGDLEAARDDLQEALDREPENFATMGVIGDFYARQGRFAEARRWYRRALERNPVDVGLQQLAETGGRPGA